MSVSDQLIQEVRAVALQQIEEYGPPHVEHFFLSEREWLKLAEMYAVDKSIVHIGVILMDIQLGYAVANWAIQDHVSMGVEYTQKLLSSYDLSPEEMTKILECVAKHHGADEYICREAEICTNADCYRFIHPRGFFLRLSVLWKRGVSIEELFTQAEYKLEEKRNALSLDYCKQELQPYYLHFKKYLKEARSV